MSDNKKTPVYFDGVKVRAVDTTTMEKLSSILSNIIELKVNGARSLDERIIKGLSSVLNDQSAEHREFILAFCRKIREICDELYRPGQDDEREPDASSPNNIVSPERSKLTRDKQPSISPSIKSIFNNARIDEGGNVSQLEPTDHAGSTSQYVATTSLLLEDQNSGDDDSEDELAYLRKQTIEDFIDDARDQLRRIGAGDLPAQKPANTAALLDSLGDNNMNFPNGPEWLSLVEKGYSDRQRGTIYYALAAVGFENWHRHQVEKILQSYPDKQLVTAKLEVSSIVLGLKPVSSTKKEDWDRRKKQLNTHLTRGRKWRRLNNTFGRGILLVIHPWKLAKAKTPYLERLTQQLERDQSRRLIVSLLGDQVDLLFKEGSVSESTFCGKLRENNFRYTGYKSLSECLSIELADFRHKLQRSMTGHQLVTKSTNYVFEAKSLTKLRSAQWLNNDLILACMHLSLKQPFVRIGWSIPTHEGSLLQPESLKAAADAIKKWKLKAKQEQHIYLFPLFQRNNHFSLLEVNTSESYIYHYDSCLDALNGEENHDIKEACATAFPQFKYVEKGGIQQDDLSSCGPIVIKVASRRMGGDAATSESKSDNNPESLT